MTSAQERIARANAVDASRNGRPTAHCLDCGKLHGETECSLVPAQRTGDHDADARQSA